MRKTDKIEAVPGVPLTVKRHAQARRISLRISPACDEVILVLPKRAALRDGLNFAREKRDWIESRLASVPGRVPFRQDARIPILGVDHMIHISQTADSLVTQWHGLLICRGPAERVPARLRLWLQRRAQEELSVRARRFAAKLGVKVRRITIRDPKTRWGSCSADGSLSFSWRLVFCPPDVLDYIAAHEVAHLVEMNHSPKFWRLVDQILPGNEDSRDWLRHHGPGLHRFG